MNIVMVGDSAVGKTTFMMSTYGLMSEGEIGGFKVRCKDERARKKLENAFQAFRTRGVYPPATVQMHEYEYDFFCDVRDNVMSFTLTDIRGESIHSYDIDELDEKLRSADTMMLFLNGYDIVQGLDISEQIDDIYILMNNSFSCGDKEKLIMVVFTQMDRVEEFDADVYACLLDSVKEIKKISDNNPNISYQPVPTACSLDCMMDLDFTMVTMMLFGYRTEVMARRKKLEDELDEINRLFGANDGILVGLGRGVLDFFGLDEKKNEARRRYAAIQSELKEYDKMIAKFEKLSKFYDDYEIGTSYTIKRRVIDDSDPFGF